MVHQNTAACLGQCFDSGRKHAAEWVVFTNPWLGSKTLTWLVLIVIFMAQQKHVVLWLSVCIQWTHGKNTCCFDTAFSGQGHLLDFYCIHCLTSLADRDSPLVLGVVHSSLVGCYSPGSLTCPPCPSAGPYKSPHNHYFHLGICWALSWHSVIADSVLELAHSVVVYWAHSSSSVAQVQSWRACHCSPSLADLS